MTDEEILQRPIGWWLKEADARLNEAFDSHLAGQGVDRRGWQVLSTLAASPRSRSEITVALASFDEPVAVEAVVDDFEQRGWLEESAGVVSLTSSGMEKQAALSPLVDQVRERISQALPQEDYVALVRLLARVVNSFPPVTDSSRR